VGAGAEEDEDAEAGVDFFFFAAADADVEPASFLAAQEIRMPRTSVAETSWKA
jgi:hypothetical protein